MAITNTKTVNTTGVTYDSGTNIAQNWIEISPAGANTFAIEDNTLSSSLKVLGSGDTIYVEGNFADYQYKQNGKTITMDNGIARTAITLSSMTTKVQVTTTVVFLDGSITFTNKAGGVKVSINGLDDNDNARSQLLTTKYADVKINADDSNTAAATYFAALPVNDVTTLPLTTSIDTINFAAVVGANTVTSGLQDGTATQTWNTGDSITGNNLTNVSLIGNAGAASIVTVTNVAAINMNLVASSTLNAGQFTNVAAVNVTNGIAAQTLTVSNATLGTTYGVSSANDYTLDINYAGATGTADTAKLSASGAGNSTTDTTFDVATGNVIEAVTLATSGTNFLTVNGGTGAATITVTGAGTNEVTIGSAAATLTYDASATTGNNVVNTGTLLTTTDIFKGGTGTADELIADLTSAIQIIPVITGIEELELTFTAAATFNASSWTGGNELDLTPTGAVAATVTNLNQTVTTLGIGEAAAIAATGAVAIGYATGASSAVTLNVGATSTTSNPAVSAATTGGLTFTGNAGALTINSVGDATNTLGDVTANAVSTLTIAGVAQAITSAGDISALAATAVTYDATLKAVTFDALAVDESLATLNVTSGAGAINLGAVTQTATASSGKNINTVVNVNGGVSVVNLGVLGFVGSGAATADLTNVTLNATATNGTVTIADLDVDEGVDGTSSTNVNLTANGGNVTLTTLTLTDSDATNIVVSATDGETATIGTLAGTTNLNSINVTGAGTVSLFGTGTSAVTGDTVVVASGLTGALTLGLGSAAGNLNVTLGNVVSGSTNTVTTGTGADVIIGGTGADTIVAGAGNDVISAGNGTNSITGGTGADAMSGGTGVDTYNQASLVGSVDASAYSFAGATVAAADTLTFGDGVDVITNFTAGAGGDVLDVLVTTVTTLIGETVADLTAGAESFFASGTFNTSTGLFTIAANGTGPDTMIVQANTATAGSDSLITNDSMIVLIGVDSADLVAGNFG